MFSNIKLISTSLVMVALLACGGGGSKQATSTITSGKVIDGYISGATVFLDLNFNGSLDTGEPSTITDEQGEYDLALNSTAAECSQFVPMVTLVPVGAIDSDFPDTPIEEEYVMVSPPSFAMTSEEDLLYLTPLTSIVWNTVKLELLVDGDALTCSQILQQQAIREDIINRLKEQELRVAQRYNITVKELYGDYIANDNPRLHQVAQALVPGLQASYANTVDLEKIHPDADIVFVEYFLGQHSSNSEKFGEHWYRREFVQISNGNFDSVTHLMSDDLTSQLQLFDQSRLVTVVRNGVNIEKSINLEQSEQDYNCAVSEWLETTLDRSSGVRNTIFGKVTNWQDCINIVGDVSQSLVTKDQSGSTLNSYTEHVYHPDNDSGFSHLIGASDSVTQADLIPVRDVINASFSSVEGHGSDYWSRARNSFPTEGDQVLEIHDSNDVYTIQRFFVDGTNTKLCGTWSSGGNDLADCTE